MSTKHYNQAASIMPALSQAEYSVLIRMRIPMSELYDCRGQSVKRFRAKMSALGKTVGFNTTPCGAYGHTLRTRAGHCLICNPRNYGFLKQYVSDGHVYIAVSPSTELIKVGLTRRLGPREYALNYYKYAGAADWEIKCHAYIPDRVGDAERLVHRGLSKYSTRRTYTPWGDIVDCEEVFECSLDTALAAFDVLLTDESETQPCVA